MEKKESLISVRLPTLLREKFGKWCRYNRVTEATALRQLIQNLTAIEGDKVVRKEENVNKT